MKRKNAASHGKPAKKGRLSASLGALLSTQAKNRPQQGPGPQVKGAKSKSAPTVYPFPYRSSDSILLVGEGNFSFAHVLCQLLPGVELTATTYDTKEVAELKYRDLKSHLDGITEQNSEAVVDFGIDATKLDSLKAYKGKKYTRIVFTFPHVGAGEKDEARNVGINQTLLFNFFKAASKLLASPQDVAKRQMEDTSEGNDLLDSLKVKYRKMAPKQATIDVTIKEGKPYSLWDIKLLAKRTGLTTVQSYEFPLPIYGQLLGYAHRRTLGFKEGLSTADNEEIKGGARTYSFARSEDVKASDSKTKPKKSGDESD
jgi:25S rRNA (uracil2634-N3)-methyltransferase